MQLKLVPSAWSKGIAGTLLAAPQHHSYIPVPRLML